MVSAHYRSHVEFSFEALDEAVTAFGRIEHTLNRAHEALGSPVAEPAAVTLDDLPESFVEAMDDDLATARAMAAVQHEVRELNQHLAQDTLDAVVIGAGYHRLRAMLGVLGIDPLDPRWSSSGPSGSEERLHSAVSTLVAALLEQRSAARAAKDFATADAIRDQLKQAGIELEDTAQGPKWTLA
jgi:cysteinyl-tRNA synthetase